MLVVELEVKPECVEECARVLSVSAQGSRREAGCLRFDVLKSTTEENVYHFYEVYVDAAAAALHKTLPHYLGWAEFKKKTAGVGESQTVAKHELLFEE